MDQVNANVVTAGLGGGLGGGQQQQLLLLQQQGRGAGVVAAGGGNASARVRARAEEVSGALQALLAECERCAAEGGAGSSALVEARARLEDKVELLQDKNEKLMSEKAALLEKQVLLQQQLGDSSGKLYSMHQEVAYLNSLTYFH